MKWFKKGLLIIMVLAVTIGYTQEKIKLDPRAAKRYTKEEIEAMDELKIKHLNFIYTKSFYIDNSPEECQSCSECLNLKPEDVDVYVYRAVRKKDQRYRVAFTSDDLYVDEKAATHIKDKDGKVKVSKDYFKPCKNIVLLSSDELERELKKIK